MELVSVIIPTRNRAALLREAIASVLAVQRDEFDVEALVIDDGSTDDTAAVAAAYPVRYLQTAGGQGASAARNVGLDAARGDYFAFLDDDDLWAPEALLEPIRLLRTQPVYGAVFSKVQLTTADRTPFGIQGVETPRSGWIFDDLLRSWRQLGSVVARASAARAVGHFDPALVGCEDWDWLLRLAGHVQIACVNTPSVLFRQRPERDVALSWRRFPDSVVVFRRHTRHLPLTRRLRLERVLWRHRGWHASQFVLSAQGYAARGERSAAQRALLYALRASAPHTVIQLARSRRAA